MVNRTYTLFEKFPNLFKIFLHFGEWDPKFNLILQASTSIVYHHHNNKLIVIYLLMTICNEYEFCFLILNQICSSYYNRTFSFISKISTSDSWCNGSTLCGRFKQSHEIEWEPCNMVAYKMDLFKKENIENTARSAAVTH